MNSPVVVALTAGAAGALAAVLWVKNHSSGGRDSSSFQLASNTFQDFVSGKISEDEFSDIMGRLPSEKLVRFLQCYHQLLALEDAFTLCDSLPSITECIMHHACTLLCAEVVGVYLYEGDGRHLYTVRLEDDVPVKIRFPSSKGVAGFVARSGEVVNNPPALRDSRFDPAIDLSARRTRKFALLCVPMRDESGATIGVLEACHKAGGRSFSLEDEFFFKLFASTAGTSLHKQMQHTSMMSVQTRYSALLEIIKSLSLELDTDAILLRIFEVTHDLLAADRVTLFLVDDGNKQLVCKISKDASFEGKRIAVGQGIAGYVAQTGDTVNIEDAYTDPRFNSKIDQLTGYKTKSILCVPVRDHLGHVVAVIQAINKANDESFTHEDEQLFQTMSVNAGIALRKSHLYEAAIKEKKKANTLFQMVKISGMQISIRPMIQKVVQIAYEILNSQRVTIFFVDALKQELWCIESNNKEISDVRIPIGKGICGYVAQSGEIVNSSDVQNDPRFDPLYDKHTGFKTVNVMCGPVFADANLQASLVNTRTTIAVVQVSNKVVNGMVDTQGFNVEDEHMLRAFCTELGSVLKRFSMEAIQTKLLEDHKYSTNDVVTSMLFQCSETSAPKARITTTTTLSRARSGSFSLQWPETKDSDMALLKGLNLHVTSYKEVALCSFAEALFKSFGICENFTIPSDVLKSFILSVRGRYHSNPFHNFFHGFHVMHTVFQIITRSALSNVLTSLDVFAILVAALCHDIDHPGHNNAFEVNSSAPLAIRYNDIAVLEMHHAATTFELVYHQEHNLVKNLGREQRVLFRKVVVDSILATDMAHHFNMVTELNGVEANSAAWESEGLAEETKVLLVKASVHAADLSGQCMQFEQAEDWGSRVIQEFQKQAKAEADQGLPVAPFMQNLESTEAQLQLQCNFIDFVLSPFWKAMSEILPEIAVYTNTLTENRQIYQHQLDGIVGASEEAAGAE